jgi:hypothetical protein
MDCIEMAVPLKTPESTAAFKSLLESDPRIDFIRMDPGTSGQSLVLVSLFNEGYIKVLDETTNEFIGVAAVAENQDQILTRDHPEVAMDGVHRIKSDRGGSGARKGGCDLMADMPRFSDPRDDDFAPIL